jgi:hypothetical protein
VQAYLASLPGTISGTTMLPGGGFLARILGYSGEQLFKGLNEIHAMLPSQLLKPVSYAF